MMLTQADAVVLTIYDHEEEYAAMLAWLRARVPLAVVVDGLTREPIGSLAVFPRRDDPVLVAFLAQFGVRQP